MAASVYIVYILTALTAVVCEEYCGNGQFCDSGCCIDWGNGDYACGLCPAQISAVVLSAVTVVVLLIILCCCCACCRQRREPGYVVVAPVTNTVQHTDVSVNVQTPANIHYPTAGYGTVHSTALPTGVYGQIPHDAASPGYYQYPGARPAAPYTQPVLPPQPPTYSE